MAFLVEALNLLVPLAELLMKIHCRVRRYVGASLGIVAKTKGSGVVWEVGFS
jgi:hypothetical protein